MQNQERPNQSSKSVVVSETPSTTQRGGYVNTAFEDGPQKENKVNDKHNVPINNSNYTHTHKRVEDEGLAPSESASFLSNRRLL